VKKLNNQLNRKNQKKNNQKNRTEKKTELKNHKKIPVRFGFGFQSLKPIESNWTEAVQPGQHLKKNKYK
jgi:hypothetical protein